MHFGDRGSESFGVLLRFFRERAGLTQEGLGKHVGYSKSQVAMVERGERSPRGQFVEIADEVVGAQGALLVLAEKELKKRGLPPWTEDYLSEERRAAALHVYQNHVVPGSLQTEAYARAVYDCHVPALDDEDIDRRVTARLERQQLFERRPRPLVSYVLEESTLTRPLGGSEVLKEQLRHILQIGRLRHVEIQVMPHNRRAHAGLNGPMILLETTEDRRLAYVEGPSGGYFVSEQPDLQELFARYGILRAQALNPDESAKLIDEVAEGL
ncbi:helix-turn-helix transcriptional regulator [Streptomyces griseorubiginosus]|uniref:helix-turn-helix domain-containing protein n=1 Tax=Streptomyces griseorubiginosus TaxID=67304 RepID=UPI002E80D07B|nr:helix-turn-helix transcriptional regulator [Streptomyces griseorubiginosus]WUB46207.1 helix-turn-helix domain-containing protein [Streptomyces griseorubiginosus]WUB54728.1 helix-turn-helix domain-containing protein [Streptomyces griseorubiginosus]